MSATPNYLPLPPSVALMQSQQLIQVIRNEMGAVGGWIDFAHFMHMALYTPTLGYYSGGSQKFGDAKKGGGDFVTAPQITPLFAQTLAKQVAQVFVQVVSPSILELGAGTGRLAIDLLRALDQAEQLPVCYYIIEVSNHLRQIQQEKLREQLSDALFNKVQWLDTLPENFVGAVLGNEVLDAIPVHLVVNTPQGLCERGVSYTDDLVWQDKLLNNNVLLEQARQYVLTQGYLTEFCPAANGLIASLASMLKQGAIFMIDYGFSAAEYYHPQRSQGTLMCHYQHYAHSNPLIYVGLQDITAHVNFTQIAETALDNGLQVEGFTSQAQFLINCGITALLNKVSQDDFAAYLPAVAAVQKLVSPAEMGDLFKVIAMTKNLNIQLLGFMQGDKRHTL